MRKFNLRPRSFKNILLRRSSNSASFKPKIIETIPPGLHFHLFGTDPPKTASLKELQLQLPQLKGKSIEEHFRIIASEQGTAYLPLLEKAAEYFKYNYDKTKANHWVNSLVADGPHCSKFRPLSEIHWEFRTGWTRYCHEDGTSRQVPYPEEDALFFDVEVCVQDGLLPTLAVALSDRAWYGWCSERLVYEDAKFPENGATLEHLIPIGDPHRGRVVIGHNVGYDRARVRESYFQKEHQIRFMDTMSMSVSMFGMADHQAETYKEAVEFEELPKDKTNKYAVKRGWEPAWRKRVTKNNLKDVANFLLGIPVDKEMRSYFVKDSIDVIREHFQELMRYCAQDNLVTALVFSKMWPMFRKRCPEDVTTLGMMNMGNAYLPINQNWRRFFDKTNEDNDNSKQQDGAWNIIQAAKVLHEKQNLDDKFITDDFWMFSYADKKWFRSLFKNTKAMNAVNDYGTKYLAADDVVLKSQIVPCLFGLIYNNRPVFFLKKHGWGYISPRETRRKARTTVELPSEINLNLLKAKIDEFTKDFGSVTLPAEADVRIKGLDCDFYKIPHPEGSDENVGDIMSKGFYGMIDEKFIRPTRFEEDFYRLISCIKTTKHWTNYRKRFEEVIDVYYDEEKTIGAIAADIRPAGTISRRSVHKLWVTLTNSTDNITLGKGIKTMIQAPSGMKLIGADVDSQEQWLAALFGDASVTKIFPEEERCPGTTPFSNMMLAGSKSDKSDLHSVVAQELRINRNDAKILNYARLYGAGQTHAANALQKSLKEDEAIQVAADLFALTKGMKLKVRKLSPMTIPLLLEYEAEVGDLDKCVVQGEVYLPAYDTDYSKSVCDFENWVLNKLRQNGLNVSEVFIPLLYEDITKSTELYFNGYETATFNFLEEEAKKENLRTPVLNCQLTDGLAPLPPGTPDRDVYEKKFKRSVMNWIVQSSAVDFLHLLLVSMNWLCKEYKIDTRFVISIHDEVRYLCSGEEAPRVALALMLSHLYVRAFISHRVGFRQLPMSVAFFSQVDCDTVLRKEVDSATKNPDGSPVENGVAWNMDDIIRITGGSLEPLNPLKQISIRM